MNEQKKHPRLFGAVKYLVRLCYPEMEIEGLENLPDGPCAVIGNHTQLHGPIACELFLGDDCHTWCASEMMELREVPGYAYEDFWSQKPAPLRPFFRLASYLIAPLSVLIFNNARTIPVYRDNRVLTTFRQSVSMLEKGNKLVIFPEHDKKHNNIVYDFQEGFVDIAKLYFKRTEKELSFVPLYIAPKLKKMYFGKPAKFDAEAPLADERRRICDYLMNEITDIARKLPEHTVIPYRNIPKRLYPKNTQTENNQ